MVNVTQKHVVDRWLMTVLVNIVVVVDVVVVVQNVHNYMVTVYEVCHMDVVVVLLAGCRNTFLD